MSSYVIIFQSTNKSVSDVISKKQSKEFNDNNSIELRSLELSTNVNDYDASESLDCGNFSETMSIEKISKIFS
ncbi:MAG TPA: hypothetical protein VIR31_06520 [Nitrososphaeraceae archaeon]